MKRLIGYARVSTDNQRDEGISGSKDLDNRPRLVEIFDCLESHSDIGGVLIFKLDRLARDLYIQEHLLRKLQDMKKTLISIKEPDICSNDPMRKAFRQFMGIVSELEKSFITMRLSGGRLNKARKGGYSGGCPAIGKELTIDAVSAATVRPIFTLRNDRNMSLREIAAYLNDTGTAMARGGRWYAGTVKYILDNSIYQGLVEYSGVKAHNAELALGL